MIKALGILLLCFCTQAVADDSAPEVGIMNSQDMERILQTSKDHVFVLFWSIDCPPCLKEMHRISGLSKAEKQLFIFVSTDGHEYLTEVKNTIRQLNLSTEKHWLVNSAERESIISMVDTSWYGETPRLYQLTPVQSGTQMASFSLTRIHLQ